MNSIENEISGEIQQEKSNILLGTLGAIVGALLGTVLWVVLYQLGVIAAIAGIAIVFLSYKGYVQLGKGKDRKAAVVSVLVSVIILILAHCFCWGLDIYNEFRLEYEITFLDAMLTLPTLAFDPEFIVSFFRDLCIGFVTIGVGYYSYIRKDIESTKA